MSDSPPEEYLVYRPSDTKSFINAPMWFFYENPDKEEWEIRTISPFCRYNFYLALCLALLVWTVALIIPPFFHYFQIPDSEKMVRVMPILLTLLGFFFFIGLPLVHWFSLAGTPWYGKKGNPRFFYHRKTGELYFARENATYDRSCCKQIIVTYLSGHTLFDDRQYMDIPVPGRTFQVPSHQMAVLIQDETDQWHRHIVADDNCNPTIRKHYVKLAEVLGGKAYTAEPLTKNQSKKVWRQYYCPPDFCPPGKKKT